MRPLSVLLAVSAAAGLGHAETLKPQTLLQDIVTFDNSSLFIKGERLMIFSGEVHPFRLPVPSLWLDIFQKVKALGLNTVSFYLDWALLEGEPGIFRGEGIFDYSAFFEAAKEAGMYLIARPGPYINAEASGGGFPGWLQRIKGHLRTADPEYLAATDNYVANVDKLIAKYQITNGGPIILYQPENEYTGAASGVKFPDPDYMQYVIDQARNAGIVLPMMSNDASWTGGHNLPGSGKGEVDIYGHDGYPLGFDCKNPTTWPLGNLITQYRAQHLKFSPSTPYTVPEFQGGSFDPWGGYGFDQCEQLINHEQVRVFYKNMFASGVTIFNLYMIFGGTNWGNLGHPGGYTSYDYAAAIAEDRTVSREKYSELKLEANFLKVSPGYLTATPDTSNRTGIYSPNTDITVTALVNYTPEGGSFYVVRHTDYQTLASTPYTLSLPTSAGNLSIPILGGSLTLSRRDSKIHVADYSVDDHKLIYSTAEIFTWKKFSNRTVLVVYGGEGETHELAIADEVKWTSTGPPVQVKTVKKDDKKSFTVVQWKANSERRIFKAGNLHIYILDRNTAYNYWAPQITNSLSSLIVHGGYLIRSASINGTSLSLQADFNTTTTLEVIGVPLGASELQINGETTEYRVNSEGNYIVEIDYEAPFFSLPDLSTAKWYYIDSLPEIQPDYDDSAWPSANLKSTNNTYVGPLKTPVSLYASDYGFHTGALLFRGHFTATGAETKLFISTIGGSAFGSSVWLNSSFVGSWPGSGAASVHNDTYDLPSPLVAGQHYVFTVLVDNMGLDEDWTVGDDTMKLPRGILDYSLNSNTNTTLPTSNITWKLTGNLGGEQYRDKARGPLNEGGLFIERQGYHLPSPPSSSFSSSNASTPFTGLSSPGVAFYTTSFLLSIPSSQYDIPLRFVFDNSTSLESGQEYRAWLYVNGFQYGRYVSHIGPQSSFPVPEGILNYQGENWVGVAVWATGKKDAKVPGLRVEAGTPVRTGRREVEVVKAGEWKKRTGAY
ncbi:beta-galactosidase precursor [Neurospora hispaniola]|uniref:Beta-galactosidase n=1 Tax=Neurospora hispaniola TaxID=588809 RepID=A0AAJ0MUG2_9PEZI|nr:beta-galactosidase precursor [Neurospora hispaniola]